MLNKVKLNKLNEENNEFYSNIKIVSIIHSINQNRFYSKESFEKIGLTCKSKKDKIDNLVESINFSDFNILIDDSSSNNLKAINANKDLKKSFEQSNSSIINIDKDTSISEWLGIANDIESLIRKV